MSDWPMKPTASATIPVERAGYHAVENKKKRSVPVSYTRNEDKELTSSQRRQLKNAIHDLTRNFPLIKWALNKVAVYNTDFSFQSRTGDEAFDEACEAVIRDRSARESFDASGRMNRRQWLKIAYRCMLADGDVFALKTGRAVQGIEGDRVYCPHAAGLLQGVNAADFSHGIQYDTVGRPLRYCICARDGNSLTFERIVRAASVLPLLDYDRFDQGRGLPAVASAVNMAQDLYEGMDAYAIKSKLVAMAGWIIKRANREESPFNPQSTTQTDADGDETTEYDLAMDGRPFILDMDPGDEMDIKESGTPPSEWIANIGMTTRFVLLALGVPYTFFDQTRGSYTIQKDAWTQWELESKPRREIVRDWLDAWCRWQMETALAAREITLPRGFSLDTPWWEWQHAGRPWMDHKELMIDVDAVKMGLVAATDVIKAHGGEPDTVLEKNARHYRRMRELDLPTQAWDEAQLYPVDKGDGSDDTGDDNAK